MTRKEAERILKAADKETDAEPTTSDKYKNRIATGLLILAKYDPGIDWKIGFKHDQMFASAWARTTKITPEDVREMGLHGWFISGEADCWSHF